jgi:hypothetical protein
MQIFKTFCFQALFFLVTPSLSGFGQNIAQYNFSAHYFHGYFIKASERTSHILSFPIGIELNYDIVSDGEQEWEHFFGFPERGFTFTYVNYRNEILGSTLSFIPHVEFYPLHKNLYKMGLRIGFGGAYHTRPYDAIENPLNVTISTHFNYTMQFRWAHHWEISETSNIVGSLGFTHFSNGAYRMPNMGINYPFASVGYTRLIGDQRPRPILGEFKFPHKTPENPWAYQVQLMAGLKGIYPEEEYGFPFYSASLGLYYLQTNISAWNLSLEFFNDTSVKRAIERNPNFSEDTDFRRIGLALGHELFFNKLSANAQVGVYLYRPYPSDKGFYKRLSLKYHYNDRLFSSIGLKTHLARANALEYGIGFKF